jgi:hypothetical protein
MSAGAGSGRSTFHLEPPDLCVWTIVGELTGKIMEAIIAEQRQAVTGLPFVLVLVDVVRLGSVSVDARRAVVKQIDHLCSAFPGCKPPRKERSSSGEAF